MLQASEVPFAEGFDATSLLFAGTLFLLSLFTVQLIWFYRDRGFLGSKSPETVEPVTDADSESADFDAEGMVLCPECSKPTEAEYRYCRHCASDTGRSYIGSRADDGSKGSGML